MRGVSAHDSVSAGLRHFAYAAGWKKFEPLWDPVIRAKRPGMMLPVLETILSEFGTRPATVKKTASTEEYPGGVTTEPALAEQFIPVTSLTNRSGRHRAVQFDGRLR